LADKVIGIGNCSGTNTDKFKKFKLAAEDADKVKAPLIKECYANFECKVVDTALVKKYNFFILQVVNAQVAVYPKFPKTLHYRGEGVFILSGQQVDLHKKF